MDKKGSHFMGENEWDTSMPEMHNLGAINWDVPIAEFIGQVNLMMEEAENQDTVIPLPVTQLSGRAMVEQIAMFNANVNCESCNAKCCREDKRNPSVMLTGKEYKVLLELVGQHCMDLWGIKKGEPVVEATFKEESYDMPLPCVFLKGHRCNIYDKRPSTCVMYPVQFGAGINGVPVMAVSPKCPEARRQARRIYITAYHLHNASLFQDALNALKERREKVEQQRQKS